MMWATVKCSAIEVELITGIVMQKLETYKQFWGCQALLRKEIT